jgi:DNA-binding beta-propeller fold protein YncE
MASSKPPLLDAEAPNFRGETDVNRSDARDLARAPSITHDTELVGTVDIRASDGTRRIPFSLVLEPDNNLLVFSFLPDETPILDRFDRAGKHLATVARFQIGDREGQLRGPSGVAVGDDGSIVIPDGHRNRILVFDPSGRLLRELGQEGTGEGELRGPRDVEVGAAERLLIADTDNHRVQVWNADGTHVVTFGAEADEDDESPYLPHGSRPGEFHSPSGVTFDAAGKIWVADTNNHRIERFDPTGGFELEFGRFGTEAGALSFPIDVRIDASGRAVVADLAGRRIQWFDTHGVLQCAIAPLEALPDGASVADVDVDDEGVVYVPVGPHARVYLARAGRSRQ